MYIAVQNVSIVVYWFKKIVHFQEQVLDAPLPLSKFLSGLRFQHGGGGGVFVPVLRVQIRRIRIFLVLPAPSASGSVSHKYGSGSGSGSFHHQAKIARNNLISTVLWLLYNFLSLKNDVNILVFRIRIRIRIRRSELRIRGSGSVPTCHGSATLVIVYIRTSSGKPVWPPSVHT